MWHGAATSQPAVLAHAKATHDCRESCHGLGFFLAEVSGEPFIKDIMLKSRQGFGIWTVNIWFFLVRNRVQNFLADSPGC